MKAKFFDRQDADNPLNGVTLDKSATLRTIIHDLRQRPPFLAELIRENRCRLQLDPGSADGCVQFTAANHEPPYLMAEKNLRQGEGKQDFLMNNALTPIPRRYCLPMQKVVEIAVFFLEKGELYPDVEWEQI